MMETRELPDGGREVVHGASYVQVVSFSPAEPRAEACLAYSSSPDPEMHRRPPTRPNVLSKAVVM
ncbi:hypothetical protein UB46_01515 [Burkholderiaceae bacterium 16]|nr:hypothetical protein UB46_01515 [Burkholderiaceae bacterium 16]